MLIAQRKQKGKLIQIETKDNAAKRFPLFRVIVKLFSIEFFEKNHANQLIVQGNSIVNYIKYSSICQKEEKLRIFHVKNRAMLKRPIKMVQFKRIRSTHRRLKNQIA